MRGFLKMTAVHAVSRVYNVTREDIMGRSRIRNISEARQMLVYVMYSYPAFGMTQREIGEFCNRERTYISHVCSKMENWVTLYTDVQEKYEKVTSMIDKSLL
jgi:chromosomal replication initiation ATPase DnaA